MGVQLLIVDDEESICSVLQDYFEEVGYDVCIARNLSGARRILGAQSLPNALILDVMLPDGNGLQYLSELRTDRRTRALRGGLQGLLLHLRHRAARDLRQEPRHRGGRDPGDSDAAAAEPDVGVNRAVSRAGVGESARSTTR